MKQIVAAMYVFSGIKIVKEMYILLLSYVGGGGKLVDLEDEFHVCVF